MQKTRLVFILLIIFAIALILALYTHSQKNDEEHLLNMEYVKDTEWLTYTDERYGLSFDYPNDGTITTRAIDDDTEHNVYVLPISDNTGKWRGGVKYSIWFSVIQKNDTSPLNCIDKGSDGHDYTTTELEGATIYESALTADESNYGDSATVCIDRHGDDYMLSLVTIDHADEEMTPQVVDSIRFTY